MRDAGITTANDREAPGRPLTLVWIDSREAILVRWRDDAPDVQRVESDVPAHRKSTGHVRHDPAVRHGGGGARDGEAQRLEHLARFIDDIAGRLSPDDDLVLIGPGTVREHLEQRVRAIDAGQHRDRPITCEASARVTERQLVARVRSLVGAGPRRRLARPVGAPAPG